MTPGEETQHCIVMQPEPRVSEQSPQLLLLSKNQREVFPAYACLICPEDVPYRLWASVSL